MTAITFDEICRLTSSSIGVFDCPCPVCGPGRSTGLKSDKTVLRVWRNDPTFATYFCARCGLSGYCTDGYRRSEISAQAIATIPATIAQQAVKTARERRDKARWLASQTEPAVGTIVESYLREARSYSAAIPHNIRHLPANGTYPPAMVCLFGMPEDTYESGSLVVPDDSLFGVHLTRLREDGSGKADANAKIMLGPVKGHPIILPPFRHSDTLIVCEGIETGLSLYEATENVVWVAGSCSLMPALAPVVPSSFRRIVVSGERGKAAERNALELAQLTRARGIPSIVMFFDNQQFLDLGFHEVVE